MDAYIESRQSQVAKDQEEAQAHSVARDGEPDLAFVGWELAHASSQRINGPSSTRWTELALYLTQSGRLVVESMGRTLWEGEVDRYEAHICDGAEEVVEALGHGWLAKELYSKAGIDAAERV